VAVPFEKADTQVGLEFADSPADRCLGLVEFTGSTSEVSMPECCLERHESCKGRELLVEIRHPKNGYLVPKDAYLASPHRHYAF
jgi:hypothetical protein